MMAHPSDRATRASHQAPTGLDHEASIPCAVERMLTQVHDQYMNRAGFSRDADGHWVGNGHRDPDYDYGIHANVVFDIRSRMRRFFAELNAQGTEARRAETENTGSVHDGPVGSPMRTTTGTTHVQ